MGFWALYSQGFDADNLSSIGSFAAAYMTVVLLEPLIDLAILAIAKTLRLLEGTSLVERSLNNVA